MSITHPGEKSRQSGQHGQSAALCDLLLLLRASPLDKKAGIDYYICGKDKSCKEGVLMISVTIKEAVAFVSFEVDHIDSSNFREFKELMKPYIREEAKFIFNIGALKYIDSSGLGAFLSILRDLRKVNGDMNMYNPGEAVKILFDLVHLPKVVNIFSDRMSAEQAFAAT